MHAFTTVQPCIWFLEVLLMAFVCMCVFTQDEKLEKGEPSAASSSGKASMKSVLDGLGDLWDQQQYDAEYDLDNFMHSLQ